MPDTQVHSSQEDPAGPAVGPIAGEYLPTGQSVHVQCCRSLVGGKYLPTGQSEQDPATDARPGRQLEHEALKLVAPEGAPVPGGHTVSVHRWLPLRLLNFPAGQFLHEWMPPSEYFPAGHSVQF